MSEQQSNWLDRSNLVATTIGILVTLGSAVGISYTYFVDYFWQIICAVEFLIILYLAYIRRSIIIHHYPQVRGVADQTLFKKLLLLQFGRVAKVAEQAEDGYFTVHGLAVRDTQIEIINYSRHTPSKEILGVEIVTDPSILFTRNEFWKSNEEHISKGGSIRRIFLVSKSTFENPEYLDNLRQLLEYNRSIQVGVGLRLLDDLPSDLVQDYSLSKEAAVIVEGRQGQEEYALAHSTVYFKTNRLKEFEDNFLSLWSERAGVTASGCAKLFFDHFEGMASNGELDAATSVSSFFEAVGART